MIQPKTSIGHIRPSPSYIDNPDPIYHDLSLGDLIALLRSSNQTASESAKARLFLRLQKASAQLFTGLEGNFRVIEEYVELRTVIDNHPCKDWVFPRGKIIFQRPPGSETSYVFPGRSRCWPTCIKIYLQDQAIPIVLNLSMSWYPSDEDTWTRFSREYHLGADHRYTVFEYRHPRDEEGRFPVQVIYKTHDEGLRSHAVGLPLESFEFILQQRST